MHLSPHGLSPRNLRPRLTPFLHQGPASFKLKEREKLRKQNFSIVNDGDRNVVKVIQDLLLSPHCWLKRKPIETNNLRGLNRQKQTLT